MVQRVHDENPREMTFGDLYFVNPLRNEIFQKFKLNIIYTL